MHAQFLNNQAIDYSQVGQRLNSKSWRKLHREARGQFLVGFYSNGLSSCWVNLTSESYEEFHSRYLKGVYLEEEIYAVSNQHRDLLTGGNEPMGLKRMAAV